MTYVEYMIGICNVGFLQTSTVKMKFNGLFKCTLNNLKIRLESIMSIRSKNVLS